MFVNTFFKENKNFLLHYFPAHIFFFTLLSQLTDMTIDGKNSFGETIFGRSWVRAYDHKWISLTIQYYATMVIPLWPQFHFIDIEVLYICGHTTDNKIYQQEDGENSQPFTVGSFLYLKDLRKLLSPLKMFDVFTSNFELKSLTLLTSFRYALRSQILIFVVFIMKTSYKILLFFV